MKRLTLKNILLLGLAAPALFIQACANHPVQPQCSVEQLGDCSSNSMTNSETIPTGDHKEAMDLPVRLGKFSNRPEMLIATDFINALTQLEQYSTANAVIKMPSAYSSFSAALEDALLYRGFQIERTPLKWGQGILKASVVKEPSGASNYTYLVAIDRIGLKRSYSINNQVISPISSLFVRGVSPTLISLNDGLFVE